MASVKFPNTNIEQGMERVRSISNDYGGPAKSNRFLIQILGSPPPPRGTSQNSAIVQPSFLDEMSFLCEAAELPGRGFMSTDIRYYGPNFKVPYQTVYEDLNLTFICRDEFYEREFFDNWMAYINPVSTYNFAYRNDYAKNVKLLQLSDYSNEAKYSFTFDKAYPILVSPQPATWADDNFHRLTVSFTYVRWYRETIDDTTDLFGADTSSLIADRLRILGLDEQLRNRPE